MRKMAYGKIYPLFALISSVLWLLCGLVMINTSYFMLFMASYMVILILFGYGNSLLKIQKVALPLTLLLGASVFILYGAIKGQQHAMRIYLILNTAVLTLSIEPISLVRILEKKKFPSSLTLGVLITLRFMTVLKEEMKRILLAIKLRGFENIHLKPGLMYRAFLMPLLIRIFSISDTLSMSLELRGFSMGKERSIYQVKTPKISDYLFLLSTLMVTMGGIYVSNIKH